VEKRKEDMLELSKMGFPFQICLQRPNSSLLSYNYCPPGDVDTNSSVWNLDHSSCNGARWVVLSTQQVGGVEFGAPDVPRDLRLGSPRKSLKRLPTSSGTYARAALR
jgi:hypothetical protein